MKNIVLSFIWFFLSSITKISEAVDWWVFWPSRWRDLKEWDIHLEDIPVMIKEAIDFFMWFAWLIAVLFVIIWAYKILFGSLQQDKTKWRDTIIMALGWFAIAILAWFIVKLVIDNFS